MNLNDRLDGKIVKAQRDAALECLAANEKLIEAMDEEISRLRQANEAIIATMPPGSEPSTSTSAFAKRYRPQVDNGGGETDGATDTDAEKE